MVCPGGWLRWLTQVIRPGGFPRCFAQVICQEGSRNKQLYARSFYKRTLDTTSRFKYITNAFDNMKKWMQRGTEEEKKKKRYIHRYLALPPGVEHGDEEKELLIEFAHQYVQALLTYCSDDLKPGMCALRGSERTLYRFMKQYRYLITVS